MPRGKVGRHGIRLAQLWPSARSRRRVWVAFRRAPVPARIIIGITLTAILALTVNWIYQVIRKPSELFFPVSGTLYKSPSDTWREYAPLFKEYATDVMTPDLLAAMAQVEGSGNPVVRTYWRWSWVPQPFQVYRPASSAVGMYQITDGTFAEARHYCIHDHKVTEDGPWTDWQSCWFNSLYTRVVPGHAVELTSAYIDRNIEVTLARHRITDASLPHRQMLAAVIHLCGAGAGDAFVRRGFRLVVSQRCGDHEVRAYLARIAAMKGEFDRIAQRTSGGSP